MEDYVSGGYYVIRTIPRPNGLSDALPENLVTMSNCFTHVMRDVIQLQWDNYEDVSEAIAEEAASFGIDESRILELVSWAKNQNHSHYIVFSEVNPALEVYGRFISDPAVRVVGIGLHTRLLQTFDDQLSKDVNQGFGLVELLKEKSPLAADGKPLGFEPLGFEGTSFHSWLCNFGPEEIDRRVGLSLNDLGLIENFENACEVSEYLRQNGERAIWEPWLLSEYGAKG